MCIVNSNWSMLTDEKIKTIKKKLRSGFPEGELKNDLRKEGFSEEEIKKAFQPVASDMRSWYLFFGLLFSLVGLWVLMEYGSLLLLCLGASLLVLFWKENKKFKE
jgi:hypothetical protein